ncbi:MAG: flagellar basal body rod protein FlgC [Deltaproteobacteria bacterium]|nr:flagellar basal body rod protein FlgC [Deltaproteobacteria bacterium]
MSVSFEIVANGLRVARMRANILASNLANIETTKTESGEPYKKKMVIQREIPVSSFQTELGKFTLTAPTVQAVVTDNKPPKLIFDPTHPDADQNGYVKYPDINPIEAMTEMLSASRVYQAQIEVLKSFSEMSQAARELLRSL